MAESQSEKQLECTFPHGNLQDGDFCPSCGSKNKINKKKSIVETLIQEATTLSKLARYLTRVFYALGGVSVAVGILLCFATHTEDVSGYSSTYTVKTHPFVSLGILIALSGILEALIFASLFRYIALQTDYRQYLLEKDNESSFFETSKAKSLKKL